MQTMSNGFKTASQFVNTSRGNSVSIGPVTYSSQLSEGEQCRTTVISVGS